MCLDVGATHGVCSLSYVGLEDKYLHSVMRMIYVGFFFFFNNTATTEIYTLSLHDALPI